MNYRNTIKIKVGKDLTATFFEWLKIIKEIEIIKKIK